MITHNAVIAGWWLLVAASSGIAGLLTGRSRPSQKILQEEYEAGHDDGWDARGDWELDRSGRDVYGNTYGGGDSVSPGRHTVVLEPGPTIYRALVPLDDESLYGPESRAKPSDSTFIRTVLMDWDIRFPIPLDSPKGNMTEAL